MGTNVHRNKDAAEETIYLFKRPIIRNGLLSSNSPSENHYFMNTDLDFYKTEFRIALNPMMDLFEFKKTKLSEGDWISYVESTKLSIISNPEQFLGRDLPAPSLVQKFVQEIFAKYLEDYHVPV